MVDGPFEEMVDGGPEYIEYGHNYPSNVLQLVQHSDSTPVTASPLGHFLIFGALSFPVPNLRCSL